MIFIASIEKKIINIFKADSIEQVAVYLKEYKDIKINIFVSKECSRNV